MKTWKKIEETKKRTSDITNLKKRNEEKVQKVSYQFLIDLKLIFCLYRKYLIFNWKMSRSDICPKTITWYQSNVTTRKRKFKMLYCFKKRKKPNNQKWSSNKMSKEKDKIILELSRKTRWRIKLDFNLKGLPKWKLKRKEDANKLKLKEIIK